MATSAALHLRKAAALGCAARDLGRCRFGGASPLRGVVASALLSLRLWASALLLRIGRFLVTRCVHARFERLASLWRCRCAGPAIHPGLVLCHFLPSSLFQLITIPIRRAPCCGQRSVVAIRCAALCSRALNSGGPSRRALTRSSMQGRSALQDLELFWMREGDRGAVDVLDPAAHAHEPALQA